MKHANNIFSAVLPLTLLGCALTSAAMGQTQEVGLTLGYLGGADRSPIQLNGGVAFQANYARRIIESPFAALYAEVHMVANPLRDISSANAQATANVATLFVTPGVRVKFLPHSTISPYLAVGGGYALFEQSVEQLNGKSNPAARFTHRGAFDFGAGMDYKLPRRGLLRLASLRVEIRDFYTGSPDYNLRIPGGQHNVVVGAGLVLRLGEK